MMNGLRKTFWSSIHKKKDVVDVVVVNSETRPESSGSRFGFFSSTPRSETRPGSQNLSPLSSSSLPASPKLHCKTSSGVGDVLTPPTTPRRNRSPLSLLNVSSSSCSTLSSPRSPASFYLFKSKLCFTKSGGGSRCGICLQSVKPGRGTAIFTAECSHTFHFPCVASSSSRAGGDRNLLSDCPVCGVSWRETSLLPLLPPLSPKSGSESDYRIRKTLKNNNKNKSLRVYNDNEALIMSSTHIHYHLNIVSLF